ncbi:MAG: hypothetical protein QGH93_11380 [Gammaproteobacteria bacterium]|nr:hypothetical protein [Chromatiales bacterium]MDP6675431.1 hypothetical protein [Gammaproteobacteria bacterium]
MARQLRYPAIKALVRLVGAVTGEIASIMLVTDASAFLHFPIRFYIFLHPENQLGLGGNNCCTYATHGYYVFRF